MSSKCSSEEFKIEAVKQITDRGCSVQDVAKRLGTTTLTAFTPGVRNMVKGKSIVSDHQEFTIQHPVVY